MNRAGYFFTLYALPQSHEISLFVENDKDDVGLASKTDTERIPRLFAPLLNRSRPFAEGNIVSEDAS